jgi:hypothetical protein
VKLRGSHWAELSAIEGILVPAGVLVASKQKLVFKGYPEFIALEREMENRIAGMLSQGLTPDEVLDSCAQRSNGVTFSVSKPKRIEARSLADAAEEMLARSKHHA